MDFDTLADVTYVSLHSKHEATRHGEDASPIP